MVSSVQHPQYLSEVGSSVKLTPVVLSGEKMSRQAHCMPGLGMPSRGLRVRQTALSNGAQAVTVVEVGVVVTVVMVVTFVASTVPVPGGGGSS